jgi:3-hydroxyisobutyrate dehydrogenase-like beta-hydroxyacid dehydrogenase
MAEFETQGGVPVRSAAEAARGARWLLTSLPNSAVVRETVLGPGGAAAGAAEGQKDLIVVAGGEPADFEACRPLFAGFSKAAYHMGPLGSGALAKLIINLVLAITRRGLAETKEGIGREQAW